MTNRLALAICLGFMAAPAAAGAKTLDVFFAGGQSNAKLEWASAIETGLKAAYGPDVLVVHERHSGHWLERWFTTGPQENYSNDFFNATGTGVLETQLNAIISAGDSYVFRGFFWFQGEGDTGSQAARDAYEGRFAAMLARLKQDLGMASTIPYCLAIVDADQDPAYDDDLAAIGRTRADVEDLRLKQIAFASASPVGSYVDTRGYSRLDVWHLPTDELARLGANMADAFVDPSITPLSDVSELGIVSHNNDGAIASTAALSAQDLISGTGGGGPVDFNGIAFFRLPDQPLDSAALSLTVAVFSGPLSGANIDVWGLGYVTGNPTMSTGWMLTTDTDSRNLLNGMPPTKIADNIVTSGATVAVGDVWQTDRSQSDALKTFLNGLYDKGASPGHYAVVRISQDAPQGGVFRGVRWGGSHRTSPDQRAKLTVMTSGLFNPGFEFGSGADANKWTEAVSGFLAERDSGAPRSGGHAFRFSVNGDQSGNANNNANVSQTVTTGPIEGMRVTMRGYVRHDGTEPLVVGSDQRVEFRLWWVDGSGGSLGFTTSTALLPTHATDIYKRHRLSALAPAGTESVRAMVIFRTGTVADPAITTGAAVVDDLDLVILPPLKGTLLIVR